MERTKGFSLVELMVAIVIIGILSVVSAVAYRGYVKRGMETEARTMLAELNAAEEVYYVRNKEYYNPGTTLITSDASLGVDFARNKYFKNFKKYGSPTPASNMYFQTNTCKNVTYRMKIYRTSKPLIYRNEGSSGYQLIAN